MEIKPCLFCGHQLERINYFCEPDRITITCPNCCYRVGGEKDIEEIIKNHNYIFELIGDNKITGLWIEKKDGDKSSSTE